VVFENKVESTCYTEIAVAAGSSQVRWR